MTSNALMRHYLDETGADDKTKDAFNIRFEEEVIMFKENSIKTIFDITPEIFHENMQFSDWASGMYYLEQHRQEALNFWRTNK